MALVEATLSNATASEVAELPASAGDGFDITEDSLNDIGDLDTAKSALCANPAVLLEKPVPLALHQHLCRILSINETVKVQNLLEKYTGTIAPLAMGEWWRLASRAKDKAQWTRKAAYLQMPVILGDAGYLQNFGVYLVSWLIRRGKLHNVENAGIAVKKAATACIPAWA